MADFSGYYKQCLSSSLIQRLNSDQQLLAAENLIKQNGLQWFSPNLSDVYIIGPNKDIVEFAIESLESLLDKNRNPLCSLKNRTGQFFKGTLAKVILKSKQILDYSKIQKTIDQIRNSTSSAESSSLLDQNVVEGKSHHTGFPGSPSTPIYHFQHSKFHYSFKAKNIQVYVYKASITDVTGIDAIVNAANADLRHDNGVAYAICEAAGYLVKQQCSQHFRKHGRIPIGQNVVTKPGNLKHLKTIIHAVGPRWDDYSDKKQCAMALHETIINVLRTADTHCVRKIAFPPISAGISKVPKDLCAQIYIKAIIDYIRDVKPNNVTEIHFVDIKDDILTAIREAHENWKKSPELLDFKNALEYAHPYGGARARTTYSDRQGQGHHPGAACEVQYLGTETMPSGVQQTMSSGVHQTIFKVEKSLTVRIYSGSIVEVSGVDALVCTVGPELKGGKLAEAFELAGGAVYTKALSNLKSILHSVGDAVVLSEPGNLKSKYVLLAIMESKRIKTVDGNTARKLKDLYMEILETASASSMKKIALTLLGAGLLVDDAANLEHCCYSLFDGLTDSRVIRGNCVKDIQVVNIHPEVTDAIVRVFHQRSVRSQTKSKYGGEVGESNSSGEMMPKLKKPGIKICHAQSSKITNAHKKEGGKKEQERYASVDVPLSPTFSQYKDDSYYQVHESSQKPVHDAKVKHRNEQLPKNTGVSVTTCVQKDTEINKLEQRLRDLEAKKIEMIKERRKKELEEKIRQAEEDLRILSALDLENLFKSVTAGTKQVQSNKSTPPLSSLSVERDREEIELERKLTELKEKKLSVTKERNKQELKENIKQLEEELSTIEAVPSKEIQEEVKRCLFCSDILRNPRKLGCGHEFCSQCFYQASEFQEGCPVCGIQVGDDDESQQELASDDLHSWYNSSDCIENS
ncbi:hypothetical protein ACJMK2_006833 [Sinanodonta woodiana]|uniref:RING-type E3 ubiquitin transferase n=1 Tax=Sinanodonta woodiana TaxID=1069815 RepID=A0ABD3VUD6_SINWO